MKKNTPTFARSGKNKIVKKIVSFVCSILVIAYFFPREESFKYIFQEGKPWKYELLTAPFDFPIYKSEEVLQKERDSVYENFQPYFQNLTEVPTRQLEKLRSDYNEFLHKNISQAYLIYLERELKEIYANGITSMMLYDSLTVKNIRSIRIDENNIYKSRSLEQLYTPKTAYETIFANLPPRLDKHLLQSCNINNYIAENLIYDKVVSNKMVNSIHEQISLASGLVQMGERIIDKGEIVNHSTYNILRSLKIVSENQMNSHERRYMTFFGQLMIITLLMGALYGFLILFRREFFREVKNVVFILMLVVSLIIGTCLAIDSNLINVYLIPYAILPIILCTFFDSRTAFFVHIITVIIASFVTSFPFEFVIMQIAVGIVSIFSLRDLTERSQLVTTAIFIFLTYSLLYTALSLIQEGELAKINLSMYIYLFVNVVFLMFAYLLIYIFERSFGYLSTVTLIELQNINQPALRKLSEECPGTFQHSLQVGTLGYEAAMQVNANAQMVRTGAFYHDIGKMKNPAYFTENQTGILNPHNQLSYADSAQMIISHVTEGVKLAEKYNLPKPLVDFIRTHHGQNFVKYFYNSHKNDFPDHPMDNALFTYPGPIPFSKETAILMMADAVEAASRSLKEYSETSISELVEKIIEGQIAEGCFRNTPLSFKDVERVKQIFKKRLMIIYHMRISYPELKNEW